MSCKKHGPKALIPDEPKYQNLPEEHIKILQQNVGTVVQVWHSQPCNKNVHGWSIFWCKCLTQQSTMMHTHCVPYFRFQGQAAPIHTLQFFIRHSVLQLSKCFVAHVGCKLALDQDFVAQMCFTACKSVVLHPNGHTACFVWREMMHPTLTHVAHVLRTTCAKLGLLLTSCLHTIKVLHIIVRFILYGL